MQLCPVLLEKGHVGKDILLGPVHESCQLWKLAPHLVGYEAPLRSGRAMVGLGEGGSNER